MLEQPAEGAIDSVAGEQDRERPARDAHHKRPDVDLEIRTGPEALDARVAALTIVKPRD